MVIWFLFFGCFSVWSSMTWGLNCVFNPLWIKKLNSPPEICHHFLPVFGGAVFVWAGTLNFTSACVFRGNWVGGKIKSPWHGQQKWTKNWSSILFALLAPLVPLVSTLLKRSYPCYGGLKKCSFVNLLLSARRAMVKKVSPHGTVGQEIVIL